MAPLLADAGTLVDLLEAGASNHAERIAFESFGARLSFSQIAGHARAIASGLQRLGLQKGDRVALMSRNVMACAPALFGIIAGGFTLVPVDPDASPQDLAAQLNESRVRVIFVLETSAHILCEAVETLETLERAIVMAPGDLIGWRGFFVNVTTRRIRRRVKPYTLFATLPFNSFVEWGAGEPPKPVEMTPGDAPVLLYCNEKNRSAALTHANLLSGMARANGLLQEHGIEAQALTLAHDQPASTALALILWLSTWGRGARQVLLMDARDPGDACKALRKSPPDMLALSPALYGALAGHEGLAKLDLSRLKLCVGAGLAPDIEQRWTAATGMGIVEIDPASVVDYQA